MPPPPLQLQTSKDRKKNTTVHIKVAAVLGPQTRLSRKRQLETIEESNPYKNKYSLLSKKNFSFENILSFTFFYFINFSVNYLSSLRKNV